MKPVCVTLGLLILALGNADAFAQQRPGGNGPLPGDPTYQSGGAGGIQIPLPQPQPTGVWIKTWGAVADGNNGHGGVAVGKMSKSAAENEAVGQCVRGGGVNCKSTLAYENQCVVILSGQTSNLVQSAGSVGRAKDLAAPECSKRNNGVICEMVYFACSDPIFRSY